MATALGDGDLARCPICLEHFKEPKQMPECDHSFCKACITTYVTKLVNTGESKTGISCPLCRSISSGPNDREAVNSWVNSLEQDKIKIAKLKPEGIRTEKHGACNSCSVFGISSGASKFCVDCFDLLCIPCSVGRHSIKSCRTHKITDLALTDGNTDNEEEINSFQLLKQYSSCDCHPEENIKFQCKKDGCLCCTKCVIGNHRKCDDVVELFDSAAENDAKQELEKMKESVGKLSNFSKSIIDARKGYLETSKQHTEAITRTLQELRRKINKLFDALEEASTDQAKAINKKSSMAGEKEMEELHSTINGLAACLPLIETATKYVSGIYLYAILQKLTKRIKQYEATVLDIWERFEIERPELKIKSMLEEVLDVEPNDTSKLGIVVRNTEKVSIPCFKECELLRNYTVTKSTQKTVKENYNGRYSPNYSDLAFLPNDSAVFVDKNNSYVCLTNKTYEVISSLKLTYSSSCTFTRDGKIAVSLPDQREIYMLTAGEKLAVVRKLSTEHVPRAIHGLETGDLAVAWEHPVAFGIISDAETPTDKVYFCKDKEGRELKSFQYISVDESRKHVIQPCEKDKAVYCFSFEGYPKFRYTNDSLEYPRGVALDRDGNIYVRNGSSSGSLHIVSPTGLGIRIIKDGYPSWPHAIAFKKNGEEFAVTDGSCNREVNFFKLHNEQ